MKRFLIFFLILFVTASIAQLDRSKRPEPGPAPEVNIGNAEAFELPNGLKVFVVENHKLPRVTFSLVLDRDPILEGKNAGYVSIAGQLLKTGTKTRTKEKLDEEIDFIGANLNTHATGVSASGLEKHKEKIVELMADVIMNANFTQPELDKLVKQTLSGLATTKDEPNAIAQRVSAVLKYGKEHPYGEPETEETVKSITLDMCQKYYETYFSPNIAYLAIVGDVNKVKAQKLVEKYLGKWAKKDVPKNTFTNPKAPVVNKVSLVDRDNSVQSVISIGYPVELPIGHEDVIKANLANLILGGSATGRLFMNLREAKAYTYGAYSNLSADELIGSFTASTSVRNSVTDSAITEIINEMKKIRNDKVTEAELLKAKNFMSGNFIRSLEEPGTVANFAINTARYNLPKDYYKNYLKNISAVTIEDIQAIAKKYIKPNNANILVVGKGADVSKTITKFSLSGKVDYYDAFGEKYDPNVKKAPEGLTAEQVVDKFIQASGGKELISKIQDETIKLTGAMQGMNITVTMIRKAPNKFYQLVDFGVGQQKTIFDGVKGKRIQMGQEQEITGNQLEETKLDATMNAFLDYAKYGVKLELTGMETLNGKDAYKVTLLYPTGKKTTQYYEVESGLLVRQLSAQETPQGSVSITTDFADYKDVKGQKVAHKIIQGTPMGSIEMILASYEINTNPGDDNFKVD